MFSLNAFSLLASTLLVAVSLACDIDNIRSLVARGPMPGGWSRAAFDNPDVVELKMAAVAADGVSKGYHVTEAYGQLVAGMNYCIRFSAVSACQDGLCETSECVVGGFKALPSGGNQAPITPGDVTCQPVKACDITQIRERAKTPMSGGWFPNNVDDSNVGALHESASQIVSARKGRLVEAFYQVVAGRNFCIRFESDGLLADCESGSCVPVSCVAGGFQPLPVGGESDPIRNVGVQCTKVVSTLGASKQGTSGNSATSTMTSFVTSSLFVFMALVVLQ